MKEKVESNVDSNRNAKPRPRKFQMGGWREILQFDTNSEWGKIIKALYLRRMLQL